MNAPTEGETGDPSGFSRQELAGWLAVELDRILGPPVGDDDYRAAITEVAVVVLVDLLQRPDHRAFPRRRSDPGSDTLYRTLASSAPGIFPSHVTEMMWDTSIRAVDAVLAHLAASD